MNYISKGDIIEINNNKLTVDEVIYCDIGESEFSKYAIIDFKTPDGIQVKYNSNYDKGKIIFQDGTILDFND